MAPPLAREAGLAVNEHNQVIVDPFLRSISHPEIYAIGDAASPSEDPGVRVRMSAGTATIMGAHGADCLSATLSGKAPKPLSFAYLGQGIALGRHNAIGFNNYPDDKPFPPYFTGRLGYLIREGSCDCWQLRYSMACLCSQGSDAMSVHNIDNRRGQRKIRCNSIEYDIYYKEGNRNGSNE